MNVKKGLIFGLMFAFLVMGVLSMQRAMPETKEKRIYKAIKVYSPYTMEKRIGGLTIIDVRDGRKEKPSAAEVLHRLDELDKEWGTEYLSIVGDQVVVMGENNQSVAKIHIENLQEREFVKHFFNAKEQ